MKLIKVQVRYFRNILDSTEVDIQNDVTCLVGKNESGKTAFLEALRRLNPAQGNPKFEIGTHYPAWLGKMHRNDGQGLDVVEVVKAWFKLEQPDKDALSEKLGDGVIKSNEIIVIRSYDGKLCFTCQTDETLAVKNLLDTVDLPDSAAAVVSRPASFDALLSKVDDLKKSENEELEASSDTLNIAIKQYLGENNDNFSKLWLRELGRLVPKFFYFSEYSKLPGTVKIRELLEKDNDDLNDGERTAKSLLMKAGAESDDLLNPKYEPRKREIESVANKITLSVLKYWTTNQELRVSIDISQETENTGHGQQAVLDELHIRVWNEQHMLSLPFEERSSGFQWFFSFLSAFSEYELNDNPIVILLDEPGVGLHAKAQDDFLRFIDERLAKRCQVIYTTHSPFMIQPGKLERTRVVEDRGRDEGAVISSDVLSTDPDTLFPLQGALGYDLAQHLFIGPDNLVVEGTSDLIYLDVISSRLIDNDREGLNERWVITPVGGADLVPTFVALLGRKKLDFTVLVDSRKEGHQKLQSLAKQKYLAKSRIVTVGEVLGRELGDIEDLFSVSDYLKLYNKAFGKKLKKSDLSGTDPLVKQIARKEKVDQFNHGKPADVLFRHQDEMLKAPSEKTLTNFERLFSIINATLQN